LRHCSCAKGSRPQTGRIESICWVARNDTFDSLQELAARIADDRLLGGPPSKPLWDCVIDRNGNSLAGDAEQPETSNFLALENIRVNVITQQY
jgi:hypothetical protein